MKTSNPIHIHKGLNYFRYISIALISGLILYLTTVIFSIENGKFPIILFNLLLLYIGLTIRFPRVLVYNDRFVIEKKCLIEKLNDHYVFKYDEIESVKFLEGYTDINYLIINTIIRRGFPGGKNTADRMAIHTKDGIHYFNRFGSPSKFQKTIELISFKIQRA